MELGHEHFSALQNSPSVSIKEMPKKTYERKQNLKTLMKV